MLSPVVKSIIPVNGSTGFHTLPEPCPNQPSSQFLTDSSTPAAEAVGTNEDEKMMTKQTRTDTMRFKTFITTPKKDGVKMSTGKILLVVATVFLFATGIWPIGIAALIALIYLSKQPVPQKTPEQRIQELEAENEKLQAELDQQLVQRVMDKVENRGEGR